MQLHNVHTQNQNHKQYMNNQLSHVRGLNLSHYPQQHKCLTRQMLSENNAYKSHYNHKCNLTKNSKGVSCRRGNHKLKMISIRFHLAAKTHEKDILNLHQKVAQSFRALDKLSSHTILRMLFTPLLIYICIWKIVKGEIKKKKF